MAREIRTYHSAWKTRVRIHSIEGLRLPFPLGVDQILTFLILEFAVLVEEHTLHLLHFMRPSITYIAVPIGFSWILTRTNVDGKPLNAWIWGYFSYFFRPKRIRVIDQKPIRVARHHRISIVGGAHHVRLREQQSTSRPYTETRRVGALSGRSSTL